MRGRRRWVLGVALLAAVVAVSGCSDATSEPRVLVIGDSLTVGAELGGLGGDGSITVDAREGRTTDEAVEVAAAANLDGYEQVIVALGTNDYLDSAAEFGARIDNMMAVLGSEVPVTWVNVDTGTATLAPAAGGVNAALDAAPQRYANLAVADWNAYLAGRTDGDELRAGDGVHDSAAGYRVRAEWMADLVAG